MILLKRKISKTINKDISDILVEYMSGDAGAVTRSRVSHS